MKIRSLALKILRFIGCQAWIRFGIRSCFIRLFIRPYKCNSYKFEVDYFGLKFAGDLKTSVAWEVFFFGAYEKYGLMLVRDLLRNRTNPICIDVGANCGTYSIFMSKFSKQVHAFEPNKIALAALKENIAINDISNITVHDVALGDKNCNLDLHIAKNADTAWSSFVYGSNKPIYGDHVTVEAVKGDDIVEKLNLQKIDLIKIDVEGYERNVLLGLKRTINKFRPIIFMEFSKFTKKSFINIDEWNAIMNGYNVHNFEGYRPLLLFFDRQKYRISKFDFSSSGKDLEYILCMPL